jgi:hypothetical protein
MTKSIILLTSFKKKYKFGGSGGRDRMVVGFTTCAITAYRVLRHFQQYFSYIVAISFIGGRNWSTQRKPQTCRKSLTIFTT